jgi:hypothetical protein
MFNSIALKLGNARKAQDFTIYPYNGGGTFTLQSDTRIARVDMTGKGTVSNPHSGGAYAPHLAMERNPVQLTESQISEIKLKVLGEGEKMNYKNVLHAEQNLTGITF